MDKGSSFLGIPRETRQQIYDYVIHLDLDYEVVKRYKDGWVNSGFCTVMYRHPAETLTVPWVNLLLTCKSINAELYAYMRSPSVLDREDSRTYVMNIFGSSSGLLTSSSWQNIPCPPSDANTLLANIHIKHEQRDSRIRTWGCGGPMPILRQLYQTLNLLLHNGPVLNRATPLRRPLRLKNLDVRASVSYDNLPEISQIDPDTGIRHCLITLKDVGLLRGYVDWVHFDDENGHTEFAIDAADDAKVPASWDRYGFEWGHKHDDSVKWDIFDEKCMSVDKRTVKPD